MKTFSEIIEQWPSLTDFASDLRIPYVNAQVMRYRDSISAEHWSRIEDAAAKRGIRGVTVKVMADIKASRAQDGKPRPKLEGAAA